MTKLQKIVGGALLTLSVGVIAIQFAYSTTFVKTKANEVAYLNADNSPELLSDNTGTMVDENGVTWEYNNAEDYAAGHVTINNGGYFGVSSSSSWGIAGIQSLRVDYTADTQSELWLLTSIDGLDWGEQLILEDDVSTTLVKNWKYIRFYNYSSSDSAIDIDCLYIDRVCAETVASEDVDSARASKVVAHSNNLTVYEETTEVSPLGGSVEAVRFEKSGKESSNVIFSFWRTYTCLEVANQKLEYDLKVGTNYGKTVELLSNNKTVGLVINSNDATSFISTPLGDNWYHIEIPMNAFFTFISGYDNDNVPPNNLATTVIDSVKFNVGTSTIDNLRISGSQCSMGFFNSPRYTPTVGSALWVKASWVGVLHSCTLTCNDETVAKPIPTTDEHLRNASPFYIKCLSSGTVTVTITLVVGYNRQQLPSITKTFTIS